MVRRPSLILLGSAVLYLVARKFDWNLPSFPSGSWYFNPITWQFLFAFGMWCAIGGAKKLAPLIRSRGALVLAVGYLAFAFLIVMTWHVPSWARFVPPGSPAPCIPSTRPASTRCASSTFSPWPPWPFGTYPVTGRCSPVVGRHPSSFAASIRSQSSSSAPSCHLPLISSPTVSSFRYW